MQDVAIRHCLDSVFTGPTDRHLVEAISRWNYFPNQKASASELPPSITTRRFTPEIAEKINALPLSKKRKKLGFDVAEYRATRYNNVSRPLGLIHPRPYAKILATIGKNWQEIAQAIDDENSRISVDHHLDGRILIMNYEDHDVMANREVRDSFGKQFRVTTDIANCFGSVYTHSLEWAVQGFNEAKAALGNSARDHWSTKLDESMRLAKRNETVGLPIGPASSSIAVEIILAAVDRVLRENFTFVRYIDDYSATFQTFEEAQAFIRALSHELSKYKLSLNIAKTTIQKLPQSLQDQWISELMSGFSPMFTKGEINYLSTTDAFQLLDRAVKINNETPDGSVIKFAVSMIVPRVEGVVAHNVFAYLLNLCWHYPILLPYLEKLKTNATDHERAWLEKTLQSIIATNVSHRRSDGVSWGLYYLERLGINPTDENIKSIILSNDCVSLAMLTRFTDTQAQLVEYCKNLANSDDYTKDQQWLLLYELFIRDLIPNPYDDDVFNVLRKYEVDFFCDPSSHSKAEVFCSEVTNPFADPAEIPNFDNWWEMTIEQ